MTTTDLTRKTIAVLATRGVEQPEITEPLAAITARGAQATVISLQAGTFQAMKGDWEHADHFTADLAVSEADAGSFDALVLPGGTLNADTLRTDEHSQAFVKAFFDGAKPVAAICHGPWILTEIGVLEGRKVTSYPSLATDLRNAGATWVDEEAVVDQGLVTSRTPGDLEAFNAAFLNLVADS